MRAAEGFCGILGAQGGTLHHVATAVGGRGLQSGSPPWPWRPRHAPAPVRRRISAHPLTLGLPGRSPAPGRWRPGAPWSPDSVGCTRLRLTGFHLTDGGVPGLSVATGWAASPVAGSGLGRRGGSTPGWGGGSRCPPACSPAALMFARYFSWGRVCPAFSRFAGLHLLFDGGASAPLPLMR